MVIDHIYYPGRHKDYPAYVIRPKVAYVGPAVVVLHNRWGITDEFLAWSEHLAHEGFIVMLPDLYQGRKPQEDGQAKQWMNALPLQEGRDAVHMAIVWLRNQAYTRAHATAVIGFERNGALGLMTATLERFGPRAVIAVASPLKDVVDLIPNFHAAVQLHLAEKDKTVDKQTLEALKNSLMSTGISHEIHIYPNTRHDFMCPGCEDYDETAARHAWERMLAFLEKAFQEESTSQARMAA